MLLQRMQSLKAQRVLIVDLIRCTWRIYRECSEDVYQAIVLLLNHEVTSTEQLPLNHGATLDASLVKELKLVRIPRMVREKHPTFFLRAS